MAIDDPLHGLSLKVTPIILTLNEAANIGRCLDQLGWARRIVVVDSGSSDATADICSQHVNVHLHVRSFDSHANQWNWALHETGIDTPWVLALDADYIVNPEFLCACATLIEANVAVGGVARFRYCISGVPLRGSLYPPVKVLFRRDCGTYAQDGHTQRLMLEGPEAVIEPAIAHDDRKPLSTWVAAQDRYARLEAEWLGDRRARELGFADRLRAMYLAPLLVPIHCLLVRGLLLDGRAGLFYTVQRTIAELLLAMRLLERHWRRKS